MTKFQENSFYTIESPREGITLCFVHIPRFIRQFSKDPIPSDFRGLRRRIFSPQEFISRFFSSTDLEMINNFKVLKKQVEWMAGKAAVKILGATAGLCETRHLLIAAEPGGAPILPDFSHITITISHSGNYAVAGLDENGRNLALDIEAIEKGRMQSIMRVAFSKRETGLYSHETDSCLYLNWTAKEAYLKYIRKGFAEGLKKVEIIDGKVLHNGQPVPDIAIDSRVIENDYAFTLIYDAR